MNIKYFKNGNINIKLDPDEVQEIQNEINRDIYGNVAAILTRLDDIILCDNCEQSAGNFTTGYVFYNCYTGREYMPLYQDFVAACKGETVKLYGHKISDADLKENYSEYFN